MSDAASKRLARFLQRRRLLFVEVGPSVGHDRAISTHDERDGATVANREYTALLRKIVRVVRGES